MSGSHFIVQKSKYLLINAPAVTLGQGHREVIQCIFPDLYFLVPNIYGLIHKALMWEAKVDAVVANAEMN